MTKIRSRVFVFAAIICFLLAFFVINERQAFAEEINLESIDRVVIDVTARDENDIYVDLEETSANNFTAEFGTTVTLRARLDDNIDDNPDELYDDVYMYYQWWYAPIGSEEYRPLSDRTPGETNVHLDLNLCAESGNYYVYIATIQHNGSKTFQKTSQTITVNIQPKKLSLEYTGLRKTYTGTMQKAEYRVTGEVNGYPSDCRVEYDSAPVDAGIYKVTVSTSDPNYVLDENEALFVITKAPLTITAQDVVVLAGYDYTVPLTYEGFCGYDDADSLPFAPYVKDSDLKYSFVGPGFYQVTPVVPENDGKCSDERSITIDGTGISLVYCDCDVLTAYGNSSETDEPNFSKHISASVSLSVIQFFDRLSASVRSIDGALSTSSALLRKEGADDSIVVSYARLSALATTLGTGSFYDGERAVFGESGAFLGIGKSYEGYTPGGGFLPVSDPTVAGLGGYYEKTKSGYVLTEDGEITEGKQYYLPATYSEIMQVVSRLFGYGETSSFFEKAQSLSDLYRENIENVSLLNTQKRLALDGAIYTENGSFVLPFVFNDGENILYVYLIFDENGVAVCVSDLEKLFSIGGSGSQTKTVTVCGRCSLYETPSMNYDITVHSCTVQINRSVLSDSSVIGFTGKATGSFSSDAAISITETDKADIAGSFAFWKLPSAVFSLRFTGTSNKETYTVVMEGVELSGWIQNICFVNDEGKTETLSSYKYDKDKGTLTIELAQTSGYIVVYHNLLWIIVPGVILLIIIIALLLFHHHDRNKHKLNRLISGSAKVEADRYRKMIGEYEEKERKKV